MNVSYKGQYAIETDACGFPTCTVHDICKGIEFYAELNSYFDSTPLFNGETRNAEELTGALKRDILVGKDFSKKSKKSKSKSKLFDLVRNFVSDIDMQVEREIAQEPRYVRMTAMADNQSFTLSSCFPGSILLWDATPLNDGESYVPVSGPVKSVFNSDEYNRPHGKIIVVKGAFLMADIRVPPKAYNKNDATIISLSKTCGNFMSYVGEGMVCFEAHGNLNERILRPNESRDVIPGHLLGFTEGIKLEMRSAGSVQLRDEEHEDYVIRLTAGDNGGYVFLQSATGEKFRRNIK